MLHKIGIITDTHWTTDANPEWPDNGARWFEDCVAKAAVATATFESEQPEIIVHLGDLVDLQTDLKHAVNINYRDDGHPLIAPAKTGGGTIPVLHCIGNHDIQRSLYTEAEYLEIVGQNSIAGYTSDEAGEVFGYGYYDCGNVRIFVLNVIGQKLDGASDSEVDFASEMPAVGDLATGYYVPPSEISWLDAQLTIADAAGMFSVVCTHHPIWDAENQYHVRNVAAIAPICEAHRVIAILSGHRHRSQRVRTLTNVLGRRIDCFKFESLIDEPYDGDTELDAAHAIVTIDDSVGMVKVSGYNGQESYGFMSGTNTISSWTELAAIGVSGDYPAGGSYTLSRSLVTTDDDYAATGADWTPLCSSAAPFTGTLDGGGFLIDGLTVNKPLITGVGLFAASLGATFSNVRLTNVAVTGASTAGGIVGLINASTGSAGTFNDCFVSGTITAASATAGTYAGGLVGRLQTAASGTIQRCMSSVDVASSRNGGVAQIGVLVGANQSTAVVVEDCRAAGSATADGSGDTPSPADRVGGLIGENAGIVRRCYSASTVSGNARVGALIGSNTATEGLVTLCYWDATVGGETGIGYGSTTGATSQTTAQLKHADIAGTLTTAGWDLTADGVWAKRTDQYPELWWEIWLLYDALDIADTFTITLADIDLKDYYADATAFKRSLRADLISEWDGAFTTALQTKWDDYVWGSDGLNLQSAAPVTAIDLGRVGSSSSRGLFGGSGMFG